MRREIYETEIQRAKCDGRLTISIAFERTAGVAVKVHHSYIQLLLTIRAVQGRMVASSLRIGSMATAWLMLLLACSGTTSAVKFSPKGAGLTALGIAVEPRGTATKDAAKQKHRRARRKGECSATRQPVRAIAGSANNRSRPLIPPLILCVHQETVMAEALPMKATWAVWV